MYHALLYIATSLEKIGVYIKKSVSKKILWSFLQRYSIIDGHMKPKSNIHYNPYEGTSLLLIDELIKSGEIRRSDKIFDIGCGAGIFILYLAHKGFMNLQGIEIDDELFSLCNENINKYRNSYTINGFNEQKIKINKGDAVKYEVEDDVNCFYLFNTFFDEETYLIWLSMVRKSVLRCKRTVKIIILYPTVASMGAMRKCGWLQEKKRVICRAQICFRCVNYLIYESKI